jgi:hypothetical protein
MDGFYRFASDSPVLTFFLFLIVGDCIVGVFRAIFKRRDK